MGTDSCSQICRDTDGSFRCECRRGFTLDPDGQTCNGTFLNIYSQTAVRNNDDNNNNNNKINNIILFVCLR